MYAEKYENCTSNGPMIPNRHRSTRFPSQSHDQRPQTIPTPTILLRSLPFFKLRRRGWIEVKHKKDKAPQELEDQKASGQCRYGARCTYLHPEDGAAYDLETKKRAPRSERIQRSGMGKEDSGAGQRTKRPSILAIKLPRFSLLDSARSRMVLYGNSGDHDLQLDIGGWEGEPFLRWYSKKSRRPFWRSTRGTEELNLL